MSARYADIIIDISHEQLDKPFQYRIPEELDGLVTVGAFVTIPFGKGNTVRKGYVIDIGYEPKFDPEKTKCIIGLVEGSLTIETQLIKLALWIRENYGSTMYNALKIVMPVKEKVGKKTPTKLFMEADDVVMPRVTLNDAQQALYDRFEADYNAGLRKTYLIHGITGSGKTEVYIQMIKKVVDEGKQAIFLIPEIALTYQTVARFKTYFGDRVSIVNSQLSKGEKYREFEKAKNGETDVMIGPRSALFTPFKNLGIIVIDEEHDGAYKSEMPPKYHARETAIFRAKQCNAAVVLGSATPSISSYYKASTGEYELMELSKRAGTAELAEVSVVDLRDELMKGNRSIVSNELYTKMKEAFDNKEQVMLFINRRGYNTFVSCRKCGHAVKCPKCDVTLSLHQNAYNRIGTLQCHYCGHTQSNVTECPACKSKLIGGYGTGTEKVEDEIKKLFPDVKTLRMDRDTTTKKGDIARIVKNFRDKKADCLIGTQMIVKGHDFADVTVVGIMLADLNLFDSDYEASERTFQLLTQAAGRAGRKDKKGSVVIQTYKTDHYAITASANQDYLGFYDMEMAYRRLLGYPPAHQMVEVLVTSKDQELCDKAAKDVALVLKTYLSDGRVVGPAEAFIGRINEVYRRVVYAKHIKYNMLTSAMEMVEKMIKDKYENTDCSVQFDFKE